MVEITDNRFAPEELEVLDDVMDLVREDRRKRFEIGNRSNHSPQEFGMYKMGIRQLRRIARDPHYKLLRPAYLMIIATAEDILDKYTDEEKAEA